MIQATSHPQTRQRSWSTRRDEKARRLARVASLLQGRVLSTAKTAEFLETLLSPSDMVALEGDNQKQADFLSRTLAQLNPQKVHDLHLVLSSISRPEHCDLFDRGIARKVDFSYAGEQSLRVAQLVEDKKLEIGAIHTYIELYARMFVDLPPQIALICAEKGDAQGNLYTGFSTEDTPTIVEATAFHDGIVVAQVNEITDDLPRVDIPGSWVDVIVQADTPFSLEPLFTRDPRAISEIHILMAMMVIRPTRRGSGPSTLERGWTTSIRSSSMGDSWQEAR